jgi:hypothetical protein
MELSTEGCDGDADDVREGVQLLSLEISGEDFYAVGSTISSPNTVFLPKWSETGELDFVIVRLNDSGLGAFSGELWDLDIAGEHIVLGGVDQDAGDGVIYTGLMSEDLTDPSAWRMTRVSSLFPDTATWVSGVCASSDGKLVVVGRESREGWGFVLLSSDRGESFTDISPRGDMGPNPTIPDASRCVIHGDKVLVAGADGLFAVYTGGL